VLATWWLGAVGGALLLWRHGSRWADVLSGTIAGAVAGALASATLACLLPVPDALPRLLWVVLGPAAHRLGPTASPWLWTPAWVVVAALCWAALGGVAGSLLRLAGQRGVDFLAAAAHPLSWFARLCGLEGVAAYLALS
jgi:hypothetical protein